MSNREVMQQALECIERLNMRGRILADFEDEVYAAIAALKAALEQPEQKTCGTCEALARTVMLDQTSHDQFKPDWKEEYQKAVELHCITLDELREGMALNRKLEKTIAIQEAILERQTARIVDLQEHIDNFDGEDR